MRHLQFILILLGCTIISCSKSNIKSAQFTLKDYPSIEAMKKSTIKTWWKLDPVKDKVPGISLERAKKYLANKKSRKVLVAIIGSGIDMDHPDLKGKIWKNSTEIADNGIDEDRNGYIDDVHGWNFLGDTSLENMESTRVLRSYAPIFRNKSMLEVASEDLPAYMNYKKAEKEYQTGMTIAREDTIIANSLRRVLDRSLAIIGKEMKEDYTEEELMNRVSLDMDFLIHREILFNLLQEVGVTSLLDLPKVSNFFKEKYQGIYYNYNMRYRSDRNLHQFNDTAEIAYGDPNVMGLTKIDRFYGTYAAGLISNVGTNIPSVCDNATIMPLRVVPMGDEYDEDVAASIEYAIDNGADVILTYFSKPISPKLKLVQKALKKAEQSNVLIVAAAGDKGHDKDKEEYITYPNDLDENGNEIFSNIITVGASGVTDMSIKVDYSNYGAKNVDVLAPGEAVYSLDYDGKYGLEGSGSLAAASITAGIAATLKSYYPKLTAKIIKEIIMTSGVTSDLSVVTSFLEEETQPFSNLTKSGKIVNLYRAIRAAEKTYKEKFN